MQPVPLQTQNKKQQWTTILAVAALFFLTLIPSIWMVATTLPQIKVDYDVTAYKAYQTERTLYQFYYTVEHAINNPDKVSTEDLIANYDHAYAAAQLLDKSPRGDLHNEIHEYNQSIQVLVGVLEKFRPEFETGLTLAQNADKLKEIRFAVYRILPQIKNMVWAANQASERFIAKRNKMLLQQSLLVIALVCVLIIGLVVFLIALYRRLQVEQAQNEQLRIMGEELRAAKIEAENATTAKTVLVGVISHELRTPFQGLMGMLELLSDAPLSESDRKLLGSAQGSANHLLQLLNDLVDLSVLETRTLKLSEDTVELPQFLHESANTMRIAAIKSDVQLDFIAEAGLPTWVSVDSKRLRQILFNLLNQSIRLTQNAKVRVEASRVQMSTDKATVSTPALRLVFSGVNGDVSQKMLEKLFVSIYESENIYAPRSSSAGMGLEIAHNLAKTMNGDIIANCGQSGAFSFEFTMPLIERVEGDSLTSSMESLLLAQGDIHGNTNTDGNETAEQSVNRSLRLLIAEDSPVNQLYLKRVLEKMGHTIHFVDTGMAALECVQVEHFDAVLLDYHMPILNGVETASMIRRLDSAKAQVKILLVTADVLGDTRERALKAGVDEVLSKPVSATQLSAALAKMRS